MYESSMYRKAKLPRDLAGGLECGRAGGAMIRQLQHAGRLSRTHNAVLIYLVHMGRRDVEEHTKDL
jgi:hypothetical protein